MIDFTRSCRFWILAATVAVGGSLSLSANDAMESSLMIDADFLGGNVLVDKIEGETVMLRQDLRDTEGWWFWWNFRVRNAAGRSVKFQFSGESPIGVRGPAVSVDSGKSWNWLGSQSVEGNAFGYVFGEDANDVRFAFAMPYQREELDRFIASQRAGPSVSTLCRSRMGSDVPLIRFTGGTGEAERRVLLTARHHACETMASYVLEGMLEDLLEASRDDVGPLAGVEVVAIPLVDYDGVQNGDQGKNRKPRDHNRDYDEAGIYPETRAVRELVAGWPVGHLVVAMDLHCPWIRGPHNQAIYMVGSSDPAIAVEQRRFSGILQHRCRGPLKYSATNDLPFGSAWNTASNFAQGKSFGRWAGEQPGIGLATSFEIPYADAGGQAVTPESARIFGRDLGEALIHYLSEESL